MRFSRILSLLLCLCLLLAVVGCAEGETGSASSLALSSGKAASSGAASKAASAASLSSGADASEATSAETSSLASSQAETSSAPEPVTYDRKTVRLIGNESKWRITGRTAVVTNLLGDTAMAYDHSAQGFLFHADCEGSVTLHLSLPAHMHFLVRVDGEGRDIAVEDDLKDARIVLAEGLTRGKHSFEIYRCNELYSGAATVNAVELNGALLPYEAPKRDFKMIVLGDSITAGNGMYTPKGAERTYRDSDATHTYAFLAAEALNADFYIMAQSGMNTDPDASQDNSCYNYYDRYCWKRKDLGAYDNTKEEVDVFVIGLGTNGWSKFSKDDMLKQIRALITRVRADHPTTKIVWCYGQLDNSKGASIGATVRSMMQTDDKLYYYQFKKPNNASGNQHPTAEANERDAQELIDFIRSNVL